MLSFVDAGMPTETRHLFSLFFTLSCCEVIGKGEVSDHFCNAGVLRAIPARNPLMESNEDFSYTTSDSKASPNFALALTSRW